MIHVMGGGGNRVGGWAGGGEEGAGEFGFQE